MALADLSDWLDLYSARGNVWFVKRLTGNDTLANETHQFGPYIPREFLFRLFPSINRREVKNPDSRFDLYIDSHADHRLIRAVYYNNRFHDNPKSGRDETRLTGFGGRVSALLDPESTGAIAVFSFSLDADGTATDCHVWVSRHETEDDLIEDRVGPVEPGKFVYWQAGAPVQGDLLARLPRSTCILAPNEVPPDWLIKFPTGEEIVRKAIELRPDAGVPPDKRLSRRRECEYEIFKSVESAFHTPRIKQGFGDLDTFLATAQSILQSRKSRAGKSLELHAREIMTEEGLRAGVDFQHAPVVEGNKRPDFIFPSLIAYDDPAFPAAKLRMLAAKTTLRDRWRQMTREADRIEVKHLLTLQEGLSANQFREIQEARVQLVVPAGLHDAYSEDIRPHLMTFESFIGDVRLLRF
jgi:hypothetical protein